MHFRTKFWKTSNLNLFDLEDIDLGSPKLQLHAIDISNQVSSHNSWKILGYLGAELAGEDSAPSSRART